MLILTRRVGETLMIGDDVTVTVLGVKGNQVRIGVNAPQDIVVHREEIYERIQEQETKKLRSQSARSTSLIDASLDPTNGIATFFAQGELTYDEIIDALQKRYQLSDHEPRVIWDLRRAILNSLSASVLARVARYVEQHRPSNWPRGKAAFVIASQSQYGIVREAEGWLGDRLADRRLFFDYNSAVTWLAG